MFTARRTWLLVLVFIIAAAGGAWWAARERAAPVLQAGTWLPEPRALPGVQLLDSRGAAFTPAQLRGGATLLFLGFTNCPDVCPATLALLKAVRDATALRPRVVMVTVDPDRDSPQQLQRYLNGFDPQFIGLTGDPTALRALADSLSAVVRRTDLPGGDYTMDHSATVYLLDRHARVVAVFTPPLERASISADLDRLARRIG
ncbi:MAG: SCO family protein [Steroidobacteraceae bacterium]|nr:SCO family protein [Steroidobacteraceae bacterium]MDW8260105.1 SCO family protein [Gammaproteobacteria bacterium]